jgi:hypothetical protein
MSGDVEPWSRRGGLAGDFLVCLLSFLFDLFKKYLFY